MMLNKNKKSMDRSLDINTDSCDIVLQRDELAPYLFIICIVTYKNISIYDKWNRLTIEIARNRWYSA